MESGIDILARPPGKETRNVGLLSGGEKTMTTVASVGRVMTYLLMIALTFGAGWFLRRTGLSWAVAAAAQLATGLLLALLLRFTEPLKSLKLLTERHDSV